MAHISGILLIDCPASALNNAGKSIEMERNDPGNENWTAIKKVRTAQGVFPYVSAQALRYWLRETLRTVPGWTSSPVFREDKVAYTDADPVQYAEDDIFGYMRAPSGKGKELNEKRAKWKNEGLSDQDTQGSGDKEKFAALTRNSPLKVSTLISIAPLRSRDVGSDFGSMSRFEGDPVLFTHEFYRTTLIGMFSIDLRQLGRFYWVDRTGYRHLDDVRKRVAEEKGLRAIDGEKAFELPLGERKARLAQVLQGLGALAGGAKQALHYTDVSPRLLVMGVAKGGNHLFPTAVSANDKGQPVINLPALQEIDSVFRDNLLSEFFVGLAKGYLDDQRDGLSSCLSALSRPGKIEHPVAMIRSFSKELESAAETWLA